MGLRRSSSSLRKSAHADAVAHRAMYSTCSRVIVTQSRMRCNARCGSRVIKPGASRLAESDVEADRHDRRLCTISHGHAERPGWSTPEGGAACHTANQDDSDEPVPCSETTGSMSPLETTIVRRFAAAAAAARARRCNVPDTLRRTTGWGSCRMPRQKTAIAAGRAQPRPTDGRL